MKLLIPVAAVLLVSSASAAESKRAPLPPAYVEACGSCHVAFPGRMLDTALERSRLCSSDPICSNRFADAEDESLHGAACHALAKFSSESGAASTKRVENSLGWNAVHSA